MYDLKKDITQWDNFMPFEKQIYLEMIMQRLESESKNNNKNNNMSSIPTEDEFRGR
jgi:hypothetical protein